GGGRPAGRPDAAGPGATTAGPEGAARQNAAHSGGLTPSTVLGIIRWVLLGALVAGGAAALSGPVLLRLSVRKSVRTG
ncbi:hypothetical protein, partial [Streptomyces sp. NPDC057682]|uniref:hypothetical protein n=1 Tax=Streptomyces sp. NPDC057682 TaxID=3346210 RepID=UPI0036C722D5